MGTTMTVALVVGTEAHIAQAGDSRAYLFRNVSLVRLTRDHTLAEAINQRPLVDTTEVADESTKHILTNSIGGGTAGVSTEVARVHLQCGGQLLVCTHGPHQQ